MLKAAIHSSARYRHQSPPFQLLTMRLNFDELPCDVRYLLLNGWRPLPARRRTNKITHSLLSHHHQIIVRRKQAQAPLRKCQSKSIFTFLEEPLAPSTIIRPPNDQHYSVGIASTRIRGSTTELLIKIHHCPPFPIARLTPIDISHTDNKH